MLMRIYNGQVDAVLEGNNAWEIYEEFYKRYPEQERNCVFGEYLYRRNYTSYNEKYSLQKEFPMEETNKLWNTKMTDLTVGDNVKMNFITPIAVVGGLFLGTLAVSTAQSIVGKFRRTKVATAETTA